MKIILSRKGFDSEFGGYPSPILPDDKMISLPIPDPKGNFCYKDLKIEFNKNYYELMRELGIKQDTLNSPCHLDPDIYHFVKERTKNWKPLFGQVGAAQGHLINQNIKENDLFLFFGTFQKTFFENNRIKFDPENEPKHVIFGYLQIGKIINSKGKVEEWMEYHPHYTKDWSKNNAIYVARDKLSWNQNLPGAGVFKYKENLVLTAKGQNLKSLWGIPILKGKKISYHTKNSWKAGLLKSVSKGQEFVIEDNKDVEEWARNLIEANLMS